MCRVQDSEDMAKKIHKLLNDEELYKNYQSKGKQRLEDFTPERIKIKLNEILASF